MKLKTIGALMIGIFLATSAHATANSGKITTILFAGPDDPNHPDVVQIRIEGGFSAGNCDPNYAAIRNTDDRKHMISFALAAYETGQSVNVVLNTADTYYSTRCTISRITN